MKTLKYGSSGAHVALLQLALNRAGFGGVETDGVFGLKTRAALIEFQRRRGLPATGESTPALWYALEPFAAGHIRYAPARGEDLEGAAARFGADEAAVRMANPGVPAGEKLIIPLPVEPVPAIPWSVYANALSLRALTARFPFLRSGTFGRSVMGRPLRYLVFGEGARSAVFTAAHHANEWLTAPALLRAAERVAGLYAAGDEALREIYSGARLWFIPLMNPDGVDLVTGALDEGYHFSRALETAADYPGVPFPDGWKANIAGTDLNLQYPAGWETAREIKFAAGWTSPAPRDYVGASPLCAPEARALAALTRQLAPACILALHSQGEVIYWQYEGYAPPGAGELAESIAAASGYALDAPESASSHAGYKDWAIASLDVPAFTLECGLGENPLPLSQLETVSAAVYAACRECAGFCAGGGIQAR